MEDEALFEVVEQQPSTSTPTLLAELGPTQSIINSHNHKLDLEYRGCREDPHELTMTRLKDLWMFGNNWANLQNTQFWHRIITGKEKWIYFIFIILREINVFFSKPSFRTCQTGPVWKEGHVVCLVDLGLSHMDMPWMLTFMLNNCSKYMMLWKPVYLAFVNQRHTLLQHDNVPKALCQSDQEQTWRTLYTRNVVSSCILSWHCTVRSPPFHSHGSFLAWKEVQFR